MRRVFIAGLGVRTPLGSTSDALWQGLLAGRTGIAAMPDKDPSLRFSRVGAIAELDTAGLSAAQMQLSERSAQLALLAAADAVRDAGQGLEPARTAVVLGCSTAGRQAEEPEIARVYTADARVHPLTVPRAMASNGTSQVTMAHGVTGPSFTLSTACASGAHAIGLGFHMVRSGLVDRALVGAHEAPLTRAFLRAWDSMRVVSPTACRPFSADRDGMSLGEGAAVLVLEAEGASTGGRRYAEIVGFGMSSDAHHITQPRPEGAAQAIRAALRDAKGLCGPGLAERIAYINAHGTGTRANDTAEAAALKLALGEGAAGRIPLSSTKGALGHSLGASSAIEVAILALALQARLAPQTVGTAEADPELGLDVIVGEPRALPAGELLGLSTSLAFGGLNAALLLRSAVP